MIAKTTKIDNLTVRAAVHAATAADRLHRWEPECWPTSPDWQPTVARFLRLESAQRLGVFLQERLKQGAIVYPPMPFLALQLTPLESVKVVILGQDPYHGPSQAQGLAFSVAAGVAVPPSLRNIFKEIARTSSASRAASTPDVNRTDNQSAAKLRQLPLELLHQLPHQLLRQIPANGSLEAWARQGVLLLNTCLTVEQGQPASHAKRGWEALTDLIIQAVASSKNPVVFMLWGAHAQAKQELLVNSKSAEPVLGGAAAASVAAPVSAAPPRLVLTANHPSPLSALRPPHPFIGCNHFCLANVFLAENGIEPVQWT